MVVQPIPEGYPTITPYLSVQDADRFISFLRQVFEAKEVMRVAMPGGDRVMHAEVRIGSSPLMLTDACEKQGPTAGSLYLYLNDVDAVYERAIQAGAESVMEPADMFYGDRMGGVKDPFGNTWFLATHIEDVPEDEIRRRAEAQMSSQTEA